MFINENEKIKMFSQGNTCNIFTNESSEELEAIKGTLYNISNALGTLLEILNKKEAISKEEVLDILKNCY